MLKKVISDPLMLESFDAINTVANNKWKSLMLPLTFRIPNKYIVCKSIQSIIGITIKHNWY